MPDELIVYQFFTLWKHPLVINYFIYHLHGVLLCGLIKYVNQTKRCNSTKVKFISREPGIFQSSLINTLSASGLDPVSISRPSFHDKTIAFIYWDAPLAHVARASTAMTLIKRVRKFLPFLCGNPQNITHTISRNDIWNIYIYVTKTMRQVMTLDHVAFYQSQCCWSVRLIQSTVHGLYTWPVCYSVLMCLGTYLFYSYLSGLLHRHRDNRTTATVPTKQPWEPSD